MRKRKTPPPVADTALRSAAKKFHTPLHVISGDSAEANGKNFLAALNSRFPHLSPLVCFAVKANPSLAVLNLFKETGCGMDVVSGGELLRALRVGVDPGKIIFSGVGKTEIEIKTGLKAGASGIHSFNVESGHELDVISKCARSVGRPAKIALRLNPDVAGGTHHYISTGRAGDKFGIHERDLLDLVSSRFKTRDLRLSGLSIHIGSQLTRLAPLRAAFRRLRDLARRIERMTGKKLEFLDLGGGLGISYGPESPPSFDEYAAMVDGVFGRDHWKLVFEPGRALVGNAGVLLTTVIRTKMSGGRRIAIVDAGMTELIRPALYQSRHRVRTLLRTSGPTVATDIVGPLCETSDFLALNRPLPRSLGPGDILVISDTGAYGSSMASHYNSRPQAAEVLIRRNKARLIRRRETFEDLIRHEKI
jgi:diaminopimelate decarboxylase